MDITEDTVMGVAGRLSGGAWPGGTDSVILQNWLLNFGAASGELQLAVADFAKWLGNARPPWSAYRVLTSSRRIALDKHPGVRLVGVVAPHGKVRPEGDGSGGQVRLWNGSVGWMSRSGHQRGVPWYAPPMVGGSLRLDTYPNPA